jgi:lipopolysaccharide cholinephosphotransferase
MNGVYTLSPDELRGLQLVLLDMLVEIDRICKKHHIRYCIIAGTLLGAVRHKGFIPWDDDLDVGMTRENYLTFRKACEIDLDKTRFFFQDHATDKYYRWGYGRLRRKDSEFVRVGQEHMKMRTGIFLDVFPLDSVPDFPPFRGLMNFYCFVLRKMLYAEAGKVCAKTACLRWIYYLLDLLSVEITFKLLENLISQRQKRNTKYVRILTFPMPKGKPYGYSRKWYEDLADIEFEGRMFPGIRDYDAYLAYKFGDYMTPPPEDERHGHPVTKFKLPESIQVGMKRKDKRQEISGHPYRLG